MAGFGDDDVGINDEDSPELIDEDVTRIRALRDVLPDLHEPIVREGVVVAPVRRKPS